MSQLVFEREQWQGWLADGGPVECRDPEGRTLGMILDAEHYRDLAQHAARAMFSDEELARARAEPGGLSTEELLKSLAAVGDP